MGKQPLTVIDLNRDTFTADSITGVLEGVPGMEIYTLELPDYNEDGIANNEICRSCIPKGQYLCTFLGHYVGHDGKDHGENVWSVKWLDGGEIPGRSGILIHRGNYPADTHGCLLFGSQRDVDFVGNSIATLARFADIMQRKPFLLYIR